MVVAITVATVMVSHVRTAKQSSQCAPVEKMHTAVHPRLACLNGQQFSVRRLQEQQSAQEHGGRRLAATARPANSHSALQVTLHVVRAVQVRIPVVQVATRGSSAAC